jgi:hypothetical protein
VAEAGPALARFADQADVRPQSRKRLPPFTGLRDAVDVDELLDQLLAALVVPLVAAVAGVTPRPAAARSPPRPARARAQRRTR